MLKVGIAGFGFMGRMHYRCWDDLDNAQIAAIADANPNIAEDAMKAVGNVEGASDTFDFENLNIYQSLDEMLANEDLDAVSITLPTFLHADATVTAFEAGVHVLCEKPMALSLDECDRMIAASRDAGKHLQIGHCIRFWPEYEKAKDIYESGEYGDLLAVTFQRLGSPPTWGADNWFEQESKTGGMPLDLHIHDADFIAYLFGLPESVCSTSAKKEDGQLVHISTRYDYDDHRLITAEGSWAMSDSFGFEMSFNMILEKASIVFDITREPAFKVCPEGEDCYTPEVPDGDGYFRQVEHFARVISGERVKQVTSPEESRDSIALIFAEEESEKTGTIVSLK